MFLSKAELDYLTANRQFSEDYRYTIKSRLQKKVQQFAREELLLLLEQGYLDLTEFRKLTENCKEQRLSLIRILPNSSGISLESSNIPRTEDKKTNGPSRIRTNDPRHVKAVS